MLGERFYGYDLRGRTLQPSNEAINLAGSQGSHQMENQMENEIETLVSYMLVYHRTL